MVDLLDQVSTNLTYFFREPAHFDHLAGRLLPELIKSKRNARDKRIRFWSAACSSGEEAYSLAMTAMRVLEGDPSWDLKILATDISTRMLRKAVTGQYLSKEVFRAPSSMVRQYFNQKSTGGQSVFEVRGRNQKNRVVPQTQPTSGPISVFRSFRPHHVPQRHDLFRRPHPPGTPAAFLPLSGRRRLSVFGTRGIPGRVRPPFSPGNRPPCIANRKEPRMPAVFIYVTAASRQEAEAIGRRMVEDRLAACANVLGDIRSFYWWQGKLEESGETAPHPQNPTGSGGRTDPGRQGHAQLRMPLRGGPAHRRRESGFPGLDRGRDQILNLTVNRNILGLFSQKVSAYCTAPHPSLSPQAGRGSLYYFPLHPFVGGEGQGEWGFSIGFSISWDVFSIQPPPTSSSPR